MKKIIIAFIMVSLIPMGMVVGGLYWAAKKNSVFAHYLHTKGTIVEINKKKLYERDFSNNNAYYQTIKYYDEKGEPYLFEIKIGSERYPGGMAEEIPLLYNPNHPEDVVIDSFLSKWLGPVMVFTGGLFMLIIASIVTSVKFLKEKNKT